MRTYVGDIICSIYNCHSCIYTYCYVYIHIYSINDTKTVSTKPAVENVTSTEPHEEIIAIENTSVQDTLPVESETLQAEESCILVDGGVKELMVVPSHHLTGRNGNVSVDSIHSTQIQSSLFKQHQSSIIPNS